MGWSARACEAAGPGGIVRYGVAMASIPGQPPHETGHMLSHSPHVGEHSRDVLAELGYGAVAIDDMVSKGVIEEKL